MNPANITSLENLAGGNLGPPVEAESLEVAEILAL